MKKSYLTLFVAAVIACSPVFVSAQEENLPLPPPHETEHPNPEMRREHHKRFAEELGLTKEQKEQAEQIRQQGREKVKPLMDKMKELHEEMDKLRKENMQEFEKILTPEQQEKLKNMKAKMDKKMEKRHFGSRHNKGHRPQKD